MNRQFTRKGMQVALKCVEMRSTLFIIREMQVKSAVRCFSCARLSKVKKFESALMAKLLLKGMKNSMTPMKGSSTIASKSNQNMHLPLTQHFHFQKHTMVKIRSDVCTRLFNCSIICNRESMKGNVLSEDWLNKKSMSSRCSAVQR